jgi:hypothetical protein
MGALDDQSFRVFIEAMCWACEAQKNGDTGLNTENANWAFRRNVTEPLLKLFHVGILVKTSAGGIIIPKWKERQKRSDSSTERVRKHRAKDGETLHVTEVKRYSNGTEENRVEEKREEIKDNGNDAEPSFSQKAYNEMESGGTEGLSGHYPD